MRKQFCRFPTNRAEGGANRKKGIPIGHRIPPNYETKSTHFSIEVLVRREGQSAAGGAVRNYLVLTIKASALKSETKNASERGGERV